LKSLLYFLLLSILLISCNSTQRIASNPNQIVTKDSVQIASSEDLKIVKVSKSLKPKIKKDIALENKIEKDSILRNIVNYDSLCLVKEIKLQRKKIIDTAKVFLGTRYSWGGISKSGIDCSGLTYNAYMCNKITIPRTSVEQSKLGVKIKKKKAKVGDLIFFKTTRRDRITHVGIVVENVDGVIKFIHASSSQGVTISSLENSYFKKAFAKIKRLL
jgi:uncharacterized protein YcfL